MAEIRPTPLLVLAVAAILGQHLGVHASGSCHCHSNPSTGTNSAVDERCIYEGAGTFLYRIVTSEANADGDNCGGDNNNLHACMANGGYEHQHDYLECLECRCPTSAPTTYHTHVSDPYIFAFCCGCVVGRPHQSRNVVYNSGTSTT